MTNQLQPDKLNYIFDNALQIQQNPGASAPQINENTEGLRPLETLIESLVNAHNTVCENRPRKLFLELHSSELTPSNIVLSAGTIKKTDEKAPLTHKTPLIYDDSDKYTDKNRLHFKLLKNDQITFSLFNEQETEIPNITNDIKRKSAWKGHTQFDSKDMDSMLEFGNGILADWFSAVLPSQNLVALEEVYTTGIKVQKKVPNAHICFFKG